jgi:hypothetical protein
MVYKKLKNKLTKIKFRQKVLLHKVQEMIKLIPHAEDVQEKLSIDNIKDVVHADILKPK